MPNVNLAPYDARQQALNRRRALAAALQQQAYAPIELPAVPGANVSWAQGAAKLAQALSAALANRRLDKEQATLSTEMQADRATKLRGLIEALEGPAQGSTMTLPMAPYQPAPIPETLGGGMPSGLPEPVTPEGTRTLQLPPSAAQVGQRDARISALAQALASPDASVQQFGGVALSDMLARQRQGQEAEAAMQRTLASRPRTPDYTLDNIRFSGETNKPVASVTPRQTNTDTPEERFISLKLREAATTAGGPLTPAQEAGARKAARAEWTAAGREENPALDALNLQIKELQVGLAEQRLAAAKGDGSLTPKQLGSVLSLGNSLKSHPAYTDMLDIHGGILGVDAGLKQQNGFGDITAINAMQRMIDPGATVRSEDVTLMRSASSWLQKILSDYPIEKLRTGAVLPDAVREQMRVTAQQLYETRARNYNATIGQQYKALAAGAGIPFEYVGQEFPVAAQPGATDNTQRTRGKFNPATGKVEY